MNRRPNDSINQPSLKDLESFRFDPKKVLQEPDPILSLKEVPICTPGNISNIQGPPKSAKSAVMGAAIAALIRALTGKPQDKEQTLEFSSALPKNSRDGHRVVVHFDTEQSPYHHQRLCHGILSRAGIDDVAEQQSMPFRSYGLLPVGHQQRRQLIEIALNAIEKEQLKVAAVFLDGVADIIADPNNAEESFDAVDWLHELAGHFDCAVITILHENTKANSQARGHLGSQIIRKSETNLRVMRGSSGSDRDETGSKKNSAAFNEFVSTLWIEHARGASLTKTDGVKISWDPKSKRHQIHHPACKSPPGKGKQADSSKPSRTSSSPPDEQSIKDWLEQKALTSPKPHGELIPLIRNKLSCGPGTAKSRIAKWIQLGWLHKMSGTRSARYAIGPVPIEAGSSDTAHQAHQRNEKPDQSNIGAP